MGMNIYGMIPRRVFQRLFDRYVREMEDKNVFIMQVPLLVTQLMSYYYPWFLYNETDMIDFGIDMA